MLSAVNIDNLFSITLKVISISSTGAFNMNRNKKKYIKLLDTGHVLLRSKQIAKFSDFQDENRLIFVVLSGRFQNLFWKKERFWRFALTVTIMYYDEGIDRMYISGWVWIFEPFNFMFVVTLRVHIDVVNQLRQMTLRFRTDQPQTGNQGIWRFYFVQIRVSQSEKSWF